LRDVPRFYGVTKDDAGPTGNGWRGRLAWHNIGCCR
jgi:hypothetical protein